MKVKFSEFANSSNNLFPGNENVAYCWYIGCLCLLLLAEYKKNIRLTLMEAPDPPTST